MGMFDNNKKNYNSCNCPHCRGGHGQNNQPQFNYMSDFDFASGEQFDVTDETLDVTLEREDPQEIIEQYLEAILECDNPEEVEEVLYEFFDDIFLHAMKETYITEIEGKIKSLSLINEGFILEDGFEDEDVSELNEEVTESESDSEVRSQP